MPNIEARLITITPEIAKELLSQNKKNRKISQSTVKAYAEAIRSGDWKANGEAIKVSENGDLLDGQHRLTAVVRAGRSIVSMFVTGLLEEVMPTIDVGKKRRFSDLVSMDGVAWPSQVASAVAIAIKIVEEWEGNFNGYVSSVQQSRFMEENPKIVDSVHFTISNRGTMKWRAQFGAAHYLFSRKYPSEADVFFARLGTGVGLESGDPVYALREKLISEEMSKKKSSRADMMAWFIKAWNAERAGQSLTKLHGVGKEGMPEIWSK